MATLVEGILNIEDNLFEMGRPRSDMVRLVKSRLRDYVQDHLWKVFSYHKDRPEGVNGWLDELNASLTQFQRTNVAKKSTKSNLDRETLLDLFVVELFEDQDIDTLNKIWFNQGFPSKFVSDKEKDKLRKLATKFVDCILNDTRFVVSTSELLS